MTNLNDASLGSLREDINSATGPRRAAASPSITLADRQVRIFSTDNVIFQFSLAGTHRLNACGVDNDAEHWDWEENTVSFSSLRAWQLTATA